MRPQVGNVIHNKYRLLRLIGDGGMGSVFEARHEVLGTTVALKFLHVELSRRQGLVQRFLQEARISAQIQSPNVVRVTDVDQTPTGLAFIVMELLEGKTLQTLYEELYRAGQRLSYADALEYSMQMLEGVAAAHRTGIVHRDLKPDNVMITKGPKGEPVIKLLDFGIAKLKVAGHIERGLTRPGVIMGTPEYMAPEQAYSADAVDSRADIFSLGVIIFEMLAGRRPVGGDDPQQIASAYLGGHVAGLTELFPECPTDLAAAVHKAMAPLAKDRFTSADAMRGSIDPFYTAIRPPPVSVHASHPSLSFARLTPVPVGSTPGDGAFSSRAPQSPRGESVKPAAVPAAAPSSRASARPSGTGALPGAGSPVPKTTPPRASSAKSPAAPEVVAAAAAGSIDTSSTAADDPPIDSSVPSRQPTPLGGLLPDLDVSEAGRPSRRVQARELSAAVAALPPPPAPTPSRPKAAGAARIPATAIGPDELAPVPAVKRAAESELRDAPVVVSAKLPEVAQAPAAPPNASAQRAPIDAGRAPINGAGTAEARPLFTAGGLGAGTAEAAPLFSEPEPELGAGTVAMDEPYVGTSTAAPADADSRLDPVVAGGTAAPFVDPLAAPPPPAPAPAKAAASALPATKRSVKKKTRAASVVAVLLLASGATVAVVGGVYAAQRFARVEDREDTRAPIASPAPVRADPPAEPPPNDPPPAATNAPPPGGPVPPTRGKFPGPGTHVPGHTQPQPPTRPGPQPPQAPPGMPTAQPQVPPGLPPFVLPTSLPFPFPGQAPPGPPPQQQQQQQPQPQPSGDSPHRHSRPPLVPIPRPGNGDYAPNAPNAYWAEPPPYFRAGKL